MGEPYGKIGIKIIPTWREKKITRHPCYNIQPWLTSWNTCCCRDMLVWQTIDDRVWYWQRTLKNYISTSTDGPCSRNGHTYIYIRWWYWSNISQVIIISEARYYRYWSWRQMLLLSCWCRRLLLICWSHILFLSSWSQRLLLKGHFTHMKLFIKITEIETLINITYIVRFLRSTDVSVFYY